MSPNGILAILRQQVILSLLVSTIAILEILFLIGADCTYLSCPKSISAAPSAEVQGDQRGF